MYVLGKKRMMVIIERPRILRIAYNLIDKSFDFSFFAHFLYDFLYHCAYLIKVRSFFFQRLMIGFFFKLY